MTLRTSTPVSRYSRSSDRRRVDLVLGRWSRFVPLQGMNRMRVVAAWLKPFPFKSCGRGPSTWLRGRSALHERRQKGGPLLFEISPHCTPLLERQTRRLRGSTLPPFAKDAKDGAPFVLFVR